MVVRGTIVQRPWVAGAAAFALLGVGLFLLKICVLDVLDEAARGAPSVNLSFKGVLLTPATIILGLAASVASVMRGSGRGDRIAALLSNPQTRKLSPLGYVLVGVILASGGALYFWMSAKLRAHGYDV